MEATSPRATREADEHVVVCRLEREHYALEISVVQEIVRMQPITEIPGAPASVVGVTSFRGHVVSVIDLRRCCGFNASEPTADTRIIVVAVDGGETYGLIVDAVTEVLRIPKGDIEPVGAMLGESPILRGIAKLADRLVSLLDLEKVLPQPAALPEPVQVAA
ncbi:MAG: chemotaxis protein CheW [Dehalococcoidia bacterium]